MSKENEVFTDDLVKQLRDDSGDWLTDLAADHIEELKAKLEKAVEASADAIWAEYADSAENKWVFRKEHIENAIFRTLAELKGQDDE